MTLEIALMPVIAAAIGWLTNWVGIKLIFYPVEFVGIRVPQARLLLRLLPRLVQDLPGISRSAIGWQGIIPSRSARIASLAFDSGISRLADPKTILRELDSALIARELVARFEPEIDGVVERLASESYPRAWSALPPQGRAFVRQRVRDRAPQIADRLKTTLETRLDDVFDPKLMVIRQMTERPELANKLSRAVGEKDLAVVVNLGLLFGGIFGVMQGALWLVTQAWWLIPVIGLIVGTVTNYLALKLLFIPREPRRIGPFAIQGTFMRRQHEVAAGYARVLSEDMITLDAVADELLNGPRSDRFRTLLDQELALAVDDVLGPGSTVAKVVDSGRYDAFKEGLGVQVTDELSAFLESDRGRGAEDLQREYLRRLVEDRLGSLDRDTYAGLILPIIEEDAWLVYLVGAVLGLGVGLLQLLLVI
ncbi:hypothetical protein [Paraconexibacter sp.]|uniref:hypothetical protein n=1 Tax=Paraconexibacter sp. TaxID=2949640 RepID=UPI00356AC183